MAPSMCRKAVFVAATAIVTQLTAAQTVVDLAVATPDLSTLVFAVTTAGLADTLSGDGPFTVFAPTNDAFAALPNGTLEALVDDVPALTDILLYHVVSGTVLSTDLSDGMMPETLLQGSTVTVSIGASVMINDATVITADVMASNGVVHIIDAVLLPPPDEPTDDGGSSAQTSKKNPGLIAGMTIVLVVGVCGCLGVALYLIKEEHKEEHGEAEKGEEA